MGCMEVMKKHGYLTNESICSGISGGSIGALLACCSDSMSSAEAIDLAVAMAKSPTFKKDIDLGLKQNIVSFVPRDVLYQCKGRLRVVVTAVGPHARTHVLSEFDSTEQLVDAVAASCFIPFYSARRATTRIRGHENDKFIDGGLFTFWSPETPDITRKTVTISPFPADYFIAPSIIAAPMINLHVADYNLPKLLTRSLIPDGSMLKDLYHRGIETATVWVEKHQSTTGED